MVEATLRAEIYRHCWRGMVGACGVVEKSLVSHPPGICSILQCWRRLLTGASLEGLSYVKLPLGQLLA